MPAITHDDTTTAPPAPAAGSSSAWTPEAVRELWQDVERRPADAVIARPSAFEQAADARRARLTRPAPAPVAEVAATATTTKPAAREVMPHEINFKPRRGARRIASLMLLAGLAATAASGWMAYQDRTTYNYSLTGILAALTGVIWAVRAGAGVAKLTVRGGQLEVKRDGTRFVFDLNSAYTPIEVSGRPGHRGWRVKFMRRGMAPFIVDASVVDGREFMKVLRYYRPE